MRIVNFQIFADCRQRPVRCIEERVSAGIVLWPEPFAFHYSPKGFDNVQMRGIRRDVEEKESSFFPDRAHLSDFSISMHAGIVEHNKCFLVDSKGDLFEEADNFLGINGFTCAETFKMVIPVNHTEDVEPFGSLRSNIDVFYRELPAIGDVAFGTDM